MPITLAPSSSGTGPITNMLMISRGDLSFKITWAWIAPFTPPPTVGTTLKSNRGSKNLRRDASKARLDFHLPFQTPKITAAMETMFNTLQSRAGQP
jgi:hypothetical protein